MSGVEFRPRLKYRNSEQLARGKLPRFSVPKGVEARKPFFVSTPEIRKLSPPSATFGVVAGTVKADFALCYDKPDKQWTIVKYNNGRALWQFQGGPVYLDVTVAIYVVREYEQVPQALAAIMQHEPDHVADDLAVVSTHLPSVLPKDDIVRRYLIDRQVVDAKSYERWIGQNKLEEWIRDGDWAAARNRLARSRDTGKDAEAYRRRISELMRESINTT